MALTAVKTSDKSWEFAGFGPGAVSLRDLDVVFDSSPTEPVGRLVGLGFASLPANLTSLAGIPVFQWDKQPAPLKPHENTCVSVDHVVIHTNPKLLVEELQKDLGRFGFELKRERTDVYPGVTQLFYRQGKSGTVMEVIVMPTVERTALWGLTLVALDLDQAKRLLGDTGASQPKKAVQPGRRILTVRPPANTTSTNIAVMTPHVSPTKQHPKL
ncbi:hypothetical protein BASA81_002695 [Batrachochytrium salamandrivorans]|nr:hypothetical protein BASA81_002695 [Batrachochytrium salamandrivorans]